ncbi:hypothetical protein I6A81_42100, partial [Frankia sp. CN7]
MAGSPTVAGVSRLLGAGVASWAAGGPLTRRPGPPPAAPNRRNLFIAGGAIGVVLIVLFVVLGV